MKKVLGGFIILMFIFSFAFVLGDRDDKGNGEGNSEINIDSGSENLIAGFGQEIRERIRSGEYASESGEQIRVRELAQNRIQLMVGNRSAECNQCNLTEEHDAIQNRTRLKVALSNGRNAEIKIMPETVAERALERLRLKNCNESNNCTIELKEVGKNEDAEARYELQVQRHYKLLGMFRVKAQERIEVNAETGEIESQNRAWWRFLARAQD